MGALLQFVAWNDSRNALFDARLERRMKNRVLPFLESLSKLSPEGQRTILKRISRWP